MKPRFKMNDLCKSKKFQSKNELQLAEEPKHVVPLLAFCCCGRNECDEYCSYQPSFSGCWFQPKDCGCDETCSCDETCDCYMDYDDTDW